MSNNTAFNQILNAMPKVILFYLFMLTLAIGTGELVDRIINGPKIKPNTAAPTNIIAKEFVHAAKNLNGRTNPVPLIIEAWKSHTNVLDLTYAGTRLLTVSSNNHDIMFYNVKSFVELGWVITLNLNNGDQITIHLWGGE